MIEWNDSLVIGIDAIDEQHKELVASVNKFAIIAEAEGKYTISDILAFMQSYALAHFRKEEEFMERTGYPDIAAHRQAHEAFDDHHLAMLLGALKDEPDVLQATMTYLENWLVEHVAGVDRQFGAYYAGLSAQAS